MNRLSDIVNPSAVPKTKVETGIGKKDKLLAQIRVIGSGNPNCIELRIHVPLTVKQSEVTSGAFAEDGNESVARALESVARELKRTPSENFYDALFTRLNSVINNIPGYERPANFYWTPAEDSDD